MERTYNKIKIVGVFEKSFVEAAQNSVAKANLMRTEREGLDAGSPARRADSRPRNERRS